MMMMMMMIRPGKRIEKTVEDQKKGCAYCYRGIGDNPKRISWPSWKHWVESWCGSDSKDCLIRNSTNPLTGSWLIRLQDVTCTWDWLGVEHWEYVHNNNNKNNNNDNNNNNNFLKIHTFSLLIRVNSIINNNNKLLIMILILLKSYKKMHTKLLISKIFVKGKRQYQYKVPAKPLHNSKFQEIS